jgi:DinB family
MADELDQSLLEALLDSWDRNNAILVNLLRALPEGGLEARAMEDSPSVAELFTHIHYVRLVFVSEDAPEFARKLPEEEWLNERNPDRIAQMLNESAKAVRDAVKSRVEGRPGHGPSLRPPGAAAATHALARGVPSRSDQAGAQAGGTPDHR